MKIDALIKIKNSRKENEELKKKISLVKEQLHFKNETGLDMLVGAIEMASSSVSEKLCKGFQKTLTKIKSWIMLLF